MRMTKLVVSFNRHFFALALLVVVVGLVLVFVLDKAILKALAGLGAGLAVYFMVASVIASYLVTEERVTADCWPVGTASQDVVFALSAAHELRKSEERVAFFREARRVLKEGGKVIVIEQLRDLANFSCFGAAALHFLSRRTWLKSFAGAGLRLADEFKLTPFMRAFVLQ